MRPFSLLPSPFYRNAKYTSPAVAALIGIVRIQAQTIFPATPHRTAEIRLAVPTPTMAPVIVCVVLTGIPRREAISSVMPPAVSAQKPPKGRSRVIR